MQKESVFTFKLERELRDAFKAEAEAEHRPASQIARELMREFVRRKQEARAYESYLNDKVESARQSARVGNGRAHDQVEAEFAERRNALRASISKS